MLLEVQVSPSTADPIQRFHVMGKKVFDDDIIRSPLFTSVSCPLSRRKRLVCAYADAPIGAHTNNYTTTSSAYSADIGDSTSMVMCWASAKLPLCLCTSCRYKTASDSLIQMQTSITHVYRSVYEQCVVPL